MIKQPRVCIRCGGKESDLIPFYQDGNICAKCRTEYNINRYAEKKAEKEKQQEMESQPVSRENVKLPHSNPVEVTRYNSIHYLSGKAKKEARSRVVDALLEYFKDQDKTLVTQRDVERAVQQIASTRENQSVINWYNVIIRVSRSDQTAFRWRALFQDWKKVIKQ